MKTKKLWSERKKEIKSNLSAMFSGVQHLVSVWKTRNGVNVYVCYEDFIPEEQAIDRIKCLVGTDASVTVLRSYSENFIKETLYGLFCGGETEILYFCGESVESAPIRRYVGRVMSGISRGEHPANFSAVNQPVLSY